MKDTELYRTLQTLTPAEMRDFRRYTDCAVFNRHRELGLYLDLIVNRRGILLKELSDESLLNKARKTNSFKSKRDLYNCRTRVLALLENFILHYKLKDPLANQLALAQYYRQQELTVRYTRVMRATLKMLKASKIRDTKYLYNVYIFKKLEFENPEVNIRRTDNRQIEQVAWAFDEFYLSEKLVYATEMVNRQNILSTRYNELIPASSLTLKVNTENHGLVNLYIYIYKLFTTPPDLNTFPDFERLYRDVRHTLTADEQLTMTLHVFNYCVRQLNNNQKQFNQAFLDLVDRMEADGTLLSDQHINPWLYKNLIHFFLRQDQIDRAEKFWQRYSPLLPESHRESVAVLAQAEIALARKDYAQVFSMTGQIKYIDKHLVVSLKVLACKAHLLLDEREYLEAQLEALSKYLRYHASQISEDRIKRLQRFIAFSRRLNNLHYTDFDGLAELLSALEKEPQVVEASWLMEFISQKIQARRNRSRPRTTPAPKRKSH